MLFKVSLEYHKHPKVPLLNTLILNFSIFLPWSNYQSVIASIRSSCGEAGGNCVAPSPFILLRFKESNFVVPNSSGVPVHWHCLFFAGQWGGPKSISKSLNPKSGMWRWRGGSPVLRFPCAINLATAGGSFPQCVRHEAGEHVKSFLVLIVNL